MHKHIYIIACLLVNISPCYTMDAPKKLTHTQKTFGFFGTTLTQQDKRNLRAADKSLWLKTPMPEKLHKYTTKEQTNCAFLAALHYAPVSRSESNNVMEWLLNFREDQQFSCYMKINSQEYHINPQFIAKKNNDKRTVALLQHNGFLQKKITTGVFGLPSDLLWACMSNDAEVVRFALSKKEETARLINQQPEEIINCFNIAVQNNNFSQDNNIADILLKNNGISAIINPKVEPTPIIHDPKSKPSKIKRLKRNAKKYL